MIKGRNLFLALTVGCLALTRAAPKTKAPDEKQEDDLKGVFPSDFAWGAATAAYQIEGAWDTDGRGPSIWDTFSHTPGKVANNENGDFAIDSYHRFKEDIDLAAAIGITHYRFSFSWPRILPTGDLPVNQKGIDYYNDVINYAITKGLVPFATLYHWDLPQTLEDDFQGWLDAQVQDKYLTFAKVVFENFGDRVAHFLTFNEPLTFCSLGYQWGVHAPGRCSDRGKCYAGNSDTEPYIVAHNVLLSHAKAVKLYRELKASNSSILQGEIGITLNCDWREPISDQERDKRAANEQIESQLSWFADPVFFGKYPDSMRQRLGNNLPTFTDEESELLQGSWDFFGLNHYTSMFAGEGVTSPSGPGGQIGPQADSNWLYVVPWGFGKLLHWVSERYANPGIFVTENGVDVPNENSIPIEQALNDQYRVDFYKGYITSMGKAMADGVKVRGYFAWSLLDNFEWADGYSKRFGMHYVDYKDEFKRYPKESAKWYKEYIHSHGGGRFANDADDTTTATTHGPSNEVSPATATTPASGKNKPKSAHSHKPKASRDDETTTPSSRKGKPKSARHDEDAASPSKKDKPMRVAGTNPDVRASAVTDKAPAFMSKTGVLLGVVGAFAAVALVAAFFIGRGHFRRNPSLPHSSVSTVQLSQMERQDP